MARDIRDREARSISKYTKDQAENAKKEAKEIFAKEAVMCSLGNLFAVVTSAIDLMSKSVTGTHSVPVSNMDHNAFGGEVAVPHHQYGFIP